MFAIVDLGAEAADGELQPRRALLPERRGERPRRLGPEPEKEMILAR